MSADGVISQILSPVAYLPGVQHLPALAEGTAAAVKSALAVMTNSPPAMRQALQVAESARVVPPFLLSASLEKSDLLDEVAFG